MNTAYRRIAARCWSLVCKTLLFAIAVCAPVHAVQAANQMTLASGNNQSAQAGNDLAQPLTVAFSGSSYVFIEWQVTSGDAFFEDSGESTYETNVEVTAGSTT